MNLSTQYYSILVFSASIAVSVSLSSTAKGQTNINTPTTITTATTAAYTIGTGGNTGILTLTGVDAVLTANGETTAGSAGTGTLDIIQKASMVVPGSQSVYVGRSLTGVGVLNVNTGGTLTSSSSWLYLGYANTAVGTVNVDGGTDLGGYNGSNIDVSILQLGFGATTGGTASLTNGGVLTAGSRMNIGYEGIGTMNLSNGSSAVSSSAISLGRVAGGRGTLNLTSHSSVSSATSFVIGDASVGGSALMNLSGTSSAATTGSTSSFIIGNAATVSGTAKIDTGSTLTTPNLVVGKQGSGTLIVANGSSISASSTFILGENTGGTGVLNIGSDNLTDQAGSITSGTIAAGTGSGTINFNQTNGVSLGSSIRGNIAVNQRGTGTTTLTGSNSYTGATTVSGGILEVKGTISASAIHVTDGTLRGSGSIHGATIDANGSLAAGDSSLVAPDLTLTSTGDITSAGSLAFTLNSVSEYSKLALGGNDLILSGGNLQLDINHALSVGDEFELITGGTLSGAFSTLNGINLVDNLVTFGGDILQVEYNQVGESFTLTVAVIPEPSTWALTLGAVGTLLLMQRRRSTRDSMFPGTPSRP